MMISKANEWIIRQLSLGEFASRKAVFSRSVRMAVKIAAFAYLLNVLSHFGLVAFGLLPYDLGPALVIATVLTPPVSFIVALLAYSVVGFAVYDLGVSRQRFEELSRTDMLSGLMNRRAFLDEFEKSRGPVSLLLFDIDRFKAVNDSLGHKAGDDVIVTVAAVMAAAVKGRGVLSRIGGEEFAVLLAGVTPQDAMLLAEEIRARVADASIGTVGRVFSVTVSGGMTDATADRGFSEIFSDADMALYHAKATGRNRIVHAASLIPGAGDRNRQQKASADASAARRRA
ncbi:diguanylate cyclase [Rhizobium sp. PDO1-076]|nr:diguanylate cyclase [Rhizobium sp. PDO1-076]